MTAIDRDDSATWIQLRDRLREIREWSDEETSTAGREVTAILDRPRETLDRPGAAS